jgi:tRNA pseudouridine38-40 synthase
MPRYKLVVEYDGTPYTGWQWQANGLSVQQVLEEAIERFAGHKVRLFCAGRTDAGVHAVGQVAHVDIEKDLRTDTVRDAANAHLRPHPVAVLSAERVPDTFNARLSALRRHYVYRILARRAPAGIDANRVWHIPWRLDPEAMQAAADLLVGHHDFTTFRAADCQAKSPMKTLETLRVTRDGEEIRVETCARSFLHHQVRSMVGTLMLPGAGRWRVDEVGAALHARDRTRCGPQAPACGLYFVKVEY